jgi:hypothetical protein
MPRRNHAGGCRDSAGVRSVMTASVGGAVPVPSAAR